MTVKKISGISRSVKLQMKYCKLNDVAMTVYRIWYFIVGSI